MEYPQSGTAVLTGLVLVALVYLHTQIHQKKKKKKKVEAGKRDDKSIPGGHVLDLP